MSIWRHGLCRRKADESEESWEPDPGKMVYPDEGSAGRKAGAEDRGGISDGEHEICGDGTDFRTAERYKKSYENPDDFLSDNKELLEQYLEYKKCDEYKKSPACRLTELMKKFNGSNGYYNIFVPAMKQLSASYAEYYCQMEAANKKYYRNILRLNEMES